MSKPTIIFFFIFCAAFSPAFAQDTLPRFTVRHAGNNRVIIGWVNNYPVTKQISIQRSHDSLINYKTIMSVTDPSAVQNGFADTKAPNDHMYYRLFVNLDKGEYFVTPSKRPSIGEAMALPVSAAASKTKDSIATGIKNGVTKRADFVPSFYVYTNKDGYVFINLPDADRKKYRIKFYENDDSFLFEIKSLKEPSLTLDKANFIHAGWFTFELYNDEKLVERSKFYLSKDF